MSGDGSMVLQQYEEWAERERRRLEKGGAKEVFEELYAHPKYRYYFEHFLEKVTGGPSLPPSDDPRLWLALYRALEPLAAWAATWGMEREWQEMHHRKRRDGQTELQFYLRTAMRRERILLDRERPLDRIRSKSLGPPDEYLAGLAGVGEVEFERDSEKQVPPEFWDDVFDESDEEGTDGGDREEGD